MELITVEPDRCGTQIITSRKMISTIVFPFSMCAKGIMQD